MDKIPKEFTSMKDTYYAALNCIAIVKCNFASHQATPESTGGNS